MNDKQKILKKTLRENPSAVRREPITGKMLLLLVALVMVWISTAMWAKITATVCIGLLMLSALLRRKKQIVIG